MFKEMLGLLSKKGKADLVQASVFFALYGFCSVGMIVIVFGILFRITAGEPLRSVYTHFAALCALVIAKGVCNMIADLKKHFAGFDVVQRIREKMIIKLKLFGLGFYTNERLGEINTVLHKDVDMMSAVVGHLWSRMAGDFLIAIGVWAALALINIRLALITAATVPLAVAFLAASIKHAKKAEHDNNSALADMVSVFVEYVRGMPVLKSFANNRTFDTAAANAVKAFGESSKAAAKIKAHRLSVFGFILDAGYALLITAGAWAVFSGSIRLYEFLIFAVISKEFFKPFASLEMYYMYYVSAADSYGRLNKLFCAKTIEDNLNGVSPAHSTIAFEKVGFSYEADGFALRDINFTIPEHSMTALVGESGSGKTTITNLLLRFYEVQSGRILCGGTDIRDIPYDDLLGKISIVMQNVQLFDASIAENIRVGKRGASLDEIIDACKKARIHDFIMSLPHGYETGIGENGTLLSGGQRQRISIARAFLKDAPILILDEMTSNVDPVNESLIQEAVSALAQNRTAIVIAHHLKTIQHADQILVFKKGSLIEAGTHAELLAKGGYYKKLWESGGQSRT